MNNESTTKSASEDGSPRCAVATCSVFPLRTLRDIFELPSYEHMERCMDELKTVMLQARATNDLFAGMMKHQGKPMPDGKCFLWPEVLEWNDDGKREIGADYIGPDGKPFLSMRTVKASAPNAIDQGHSPAKENL
jgi:hypothetical protein